MAHGKCSSAPHLTIRALRYGCDHAAAVRAMIITAPPLYPMSRVVVVTRLAWWLLRRMGEALVTGPYQQGATGLGMVNVFPGGVEVRTEESFQVCPGDRAD